MAVEKPWYTVAQEEEAISIRMVPELYAQTSMDARYELNKKVASLCKGKLPVEVDREAVVQIVEDWVNNLIETKQITLE